MISFVHVIIALNDALIFYGLDWKFLSYSFSFVEFVCSYKNELQIFSNSYGM